MKFSSKQIISFLLLAAIPLFEITGCSDNKNQSSRSSSVIKNDFGTYYLSKCGLVKLNEDESVDLVEYTYEKQIDSKDQDSTLFNNIALSLNKNIAVGNNIYFQDENDNNKLYKCTFEKKNEVIKENWIDINTLKNSCVSVLNTDSGYTGNMDNWQFYGDYVYFNYIPTQDYLSVEKEISYRLGRISLDGTSIEFINDTIASTYAIKDGWIYFYDNGYTYDDSISYGYSIDYNRAGIYKMKCDGTEKQLLIEDFKQVADDAENYNIKKYNIVCDDFSIRDKFIYFLDYSDRGKSRVCRLNIEDNNIDYVSDISAYNYTVDEENHTLYYSSGQYNESQTDPRTIYKLDLNNSEEQELFKYGRYGNPELNIYDDSLYIYSHSFRVGDSKEKADVCGMRYNISTSKMDALYGYRESDNINVGRATKTVISKPYLYWEEMELMYEHY